MCIKCSRLSSSSKYLYPSFLHDKSSVEFTSVLPWHPMAQVQTTPCRFTRIWSPCGNSFQGDFIQTEWVSNHNYGSGGCFGMLTLTSGILLSTRKLGRAEQGGSEKSMAFQFDVNMLQTHGIFQKELRWILKPILLA